MSREAIPVSTIPTCSDFFFIALKLGRIDVVIGEVDTCTPGGLVVRTAEGPEPAGGAAAAETVQVALGLYPIVTSQHSSTALYQGSHHIKT